MHLCLLHSSPVISSSATSVLFSVFLQHNFFIPHNKGLYRIGSAKAGEEKLKITRKVGGTYFSSEEIIMEESLSQHTGEDYESECIFMCTHNHIIDLLLL